MKPNEHKKFISRIVDIVEKHNGNIKIENDCDDEGVIAFCITISFDGKDRFQSRTLMDSTWFKKISNVQDSKYLTSIFNLTNKWIRFNRISKN